MPTGFHLMLLLRIALWSMMVPFLLRFFSMPRLMRVLTPKRTAAVEEDMETARYIAFYVRTILRQNPANLGKMCLKRSLLLYRFLRMYNVPARLLVGVRKEQGKLTGHSWIEINGQHFQDPLESVPYKVTFSYPEENGA
ncbi:MAG: lasso peptide biosynthesis B2 protein [bacterium]